MMYRINQEIDILCSTCHDIREKVEIRTKFHYKILMV